VFFFNDEYNLTIVIDWSHVQAAFMEYRQFHQNFIFSLRYPMRRIDLLSSSGISLYSSLRRWRKMNC